MQKVMAQIVDSVTVEWLILADAGQVVGQKLYLLGGGWNRLTVNALPRNQAIAIAVSFEIPWTETNKKHNCEIEFLDGDGTRLGESVQGQFEVGRPPGMPEGQGQRFQLMVNAVVEFTKLGTYEVVARVHGEAERHFPFHVVGTPDVEGSKPQ